MSRFSEWPSRRFIAGAFIIVFIAAVAFYAVYEMRYISNPAERAYVKGWRSLRIDSEASVDYGKSLPYFRKAVRLNPKELRYQLSWVQACCNNKRVLDALVKDEDLCQEARAMAAYNRAFMADGSGGLVPPPVASKQVVDTDAKIPFLDMARRLDKRNAMACYSEAIALYELGRDQEAATLVREGNSRPLLRTYAYFDPAMQNTNLYDFFFADAFSTFARMRELARYQVVYANRLSRQKYVQEAIAVLEDTTVMSRQLAGSEPKTYISYLVGTATFRIGSAWLDPMYKDFDMPREREKLLKMEKGFNAGTEVLQRELSRDVWKSWLDPIGANGRGILLYAYFFGTAQSAAVGALLVIAGLYWVLTRTVRGRCSEPRFEMAVWGGGQLARIIAPLSLFIIALSIPALYVVNRYWTAWEPVRSYAAFTIIQQVLGALAGIIIVILMLRAMRRTYTASEGRTGWFRFLFRLPAAHAEWRTRQLAAGLGACVIFLVWLGLALMAVSRPILGAYPWQTYLINTGGYEYEGKIVARVLRGIPE